MTENKRKNGINNVALASKNKCAFSLLKQKLE